MGKKAAPTRRRNYGNGHGYYLDGTEIVGRGVTTIIGTGHPKNALQYWAAREVAACACDERDIWEPLLRRDRDAAFEYLKEAPFRDRDAAARRGTEVHRIAELLHAGEEIQVPDELIGHVDQYLDWWETWQPTDCIVEGVVVNRTHRYMGTFDLIATFDGWFPDRADQPARILLDLKTSRSGVYPEVAMQLAAYRHAESYLPDPDGGDELDMPQVDGCAVLHVTGDQWSFVPVTADERVFRQFLYVAQVAEFIGSKKHPGWGEDLVGAPVPAPYEKF